MLFQDELFYKELKIQCRAATFDAIHAGIETYANVLRNEAFFSRCMQTMEMIGKQENVVHSGLKLLIESHALAKEEIGRAGPEAYESWLKQNARSLNALKNSEYFKDELFQITDEEITLSDETKNSLNTFFDGLIKSFARQIPWGGIYAQDEAKSDRLEEQVNQSAAFYQDRLLSSLMKSNNLSDFKQSLAEKTNLFKQYVLALKQEIKQQRTDDEKASASSQIVAAEIADKKTLSIEDLLTWEELTSNLHAIDSRSEAQLHLKNQLLQYVDQNKASSAPLINERQDCGYLIYCLQLVSNGDNDEGRLFNVTSLPITQDPVGVDLLLPILPVGSPLKQRLELFLDKINHGILLYTPSPLNVNAAPMFNPIIHYKEEVSLPLTADEYYQLYWKYINKTAGDKAAKDQEALFNDLYLACYYLTLAATLGHSKAASSCHSKPDALLLSEIDVSANAELTARLQEFTPESPFYNAAQRLLPTLPNKPTLMSAEQAIKFPCSADNNNSYALAIDADKLNLIPPAVICFEDTASGKEVARFELRENGVLFQAYGDPIRLTINGTLNGPLYTFKNPGSQLELAAHFTAEKDLSLEANVSRLHYTGNIHAANALHWQMYGELEIDAACEIKADKELDLKARALDLMGSLQTHGSAQLQLGASLKMGEKSQCAASAQLNIQCSDGIYLHGAAQVLAQDLCIHAKSLLSTDKSAVVVENEAEIKVANQIIIDKESRWFAGSMSAAAKEIKNYSPSLVFDRAYFAVEDELVNYATGVIKTKNLLELSGGSVWNAGKINYGEQLQTFLKKLFVLGAAGAEALSESLRNQGKADTSLLQGEDADIVAGAYINMYSLMLMRKLSLEALVEINMGTTASTTSHKSRIVSIDSSLNVPNLPQMKKDMLTFIRKVEAGESNEAVNAAMLAFLPSCSQTAVSELKLGGADISGSIQNQSVYSMMQGRTRAAATIADEFVDATHKDGLDIANQRMQQGAKLFHSGEVLAEQTIANVNELNEAGNITAHTHIMRGRNINYTGKTKAQSLMAFASNELNFGGHAVVSEAHLQANNHLTLRGDIELDGTVFPSAQPNVFALTMQAKQVTQKKRSKISGNTAAMAISGEDVALLGKRQLQTEVVNAENKLTHAGEEKIGLAVLQANIIDFAARTTLANSNTDSALLAKAEKFNMRPESSVTGEGSFSVSAKEGKVSQVDTTQIEIDFDHIADIEDLLLSQGIYKNVKPRGSLFVRTQDNLQFSHDLHLPFSATVSALAFDITGNIRGEKNVALIATQGDIHTAHNKMNIDGELLFDTQGSYKNDQGDICAGEFYVHAQNDVVNKAGALRSPIYLEVIAEHGNIVNTATEEKVRGEYDWMKAYHPSMLQGGTGVNHDGVGANFQTGGKLINDASVITSLGHNYLSADQGIESIARANQYKSYSKKWRGWYGKKATTTEYSYQVQPSLIYSLQGENNLMSREGGIGSVSTNFFAQRGSNLSAKSNITLSGLVTDKTCNKNKSNLWGIVHSKERQRDEYAIPTVIVDLEDTRIVSLSDVKLPNALVMGPGKLSLKGKNVEISAPILNHHWVNDSFAMKVVLPDLSVIPGFSLYQDSKALMGSQGGLATFANVSNLGVDSINTVNNLVNAYAQGSLSAACCPSVGLDYTHTHTKAHSQTVAPNVGISRDSLDIEAEDEISFLNGVPINILGNASVKARTLKQSGAALNSSMQSQSEGITLGMNIQGNPNVGAHASGSHYRQTVYANQHFQVGGLLTTNVDHLEMHAANTQAGRWAGKIGKLSIVSPSNTMKNNSWNAQMSTNGNMGFHEASHEAAWIDEPSGINVMEGINDGNGSAIEVNETYLKAGKITTEGENHYRTNTLRCEEQREYSKGQSFGMSGNVNDFHGSSSQAIPTMGVSFSDKDYRAKQYSTIYGDKGTFVEAKTIIGKLNQDDSDGKVVENDDCTDMDLKVPFYNKSGMEGLANNLDYLWGRDNAAALPVRTPQQKKKKNEMNDHDDAEEFIKRTEVDMQEVSRALNENLEIDVSKNAISAGLGELHAGMQQEKELQQLEDEINHAVHRSLPKPILAITPSPYLKKLEDFSESDFSKDFNDETMELRSSRALRWQGLPAASNMSIWAQNKPSLSRGSDKLPLTEMRNELLLWDVCSSQKKIQENKFPSYRRELYRDTLFAQLNKSRDQNTPNNPCNVIRFERSNYSRQKIENGFWRTIGFINGAGDTLFYPLHHPYDTVAGLVTTAAQIGIVGFGADYDGSAKAYFQNIGVGLRSTWNDVFNSDPYTSGYSIGFISGSIASLPKSRIGISALGEMGEVAAARALFKSKINPEAALARKQIMIKENVGYNVTPTGWFDNPTIGKNGTYLTDKNAITSVIGNFRPNQELQVGLISGANKISFFKGTQLGLGLGLENPYQLNNGFRFSEIRGINQMNPRLPTNNIANKNFLGDNVGLPNGGPEIIIDSLSSKSWPWR